MKLPKTDIMIRAAALITRPPVASPSRTAFRGSFVWVRACSIWLIRNTW